jgi:hypothetical protein
MHTAWLSLRRKDSLREIKSAALTALSQCNGAAFHMMKHRKAAAVLPIHPLEQK